jgi:hypothetical protein
MVVWRRRNTDPSESLNLHLPKDATRKKHLEEKVG